MSYTLRTTNRIKYKSKREEKLTKVMCFRLYTSSFNQKFNIYRPVPAGKELFLSALEHAENSSLKLTS